MIFWAFFAKKTYKNHLFLIKKRPSELPDTIISLMVVLTLSPRGSSVKANVPAN
jgi:hypothetical protein